MLADEGTTMLYDVQLSTFNMNKEQFTEQNRQGDNIVVQCTAINIDLEKQKTVNRERDRQQWQLM